MGLPDGKFPRARKMENSEVPSIASLAQAPQNRKRCMLVTGNIGEVQTEIKVIID